MQPGNFYKWVEGRELCDLKNDKLETKNLFGQKGYGKTTASLLKQLHSLIEEYEDNGARDLLQVEKQTKGKGYF